MVEPPKLVSSREAAQALGLAQSTLWRWHHDPNNPIKAAMVTPGRHLRWDIAELQRQLLRYTPAQPEPQQEAAPMPDPTPSTVPTNPPVATAIVTSELGVLVGQRNDGKPPWTFIAGKAHDGEPIADAAVREVKEETGLVVRAAETVIGRRIHPKTGWDMHYVACYPVEGTDVFVGDTEELADVCWVPTVAALADLMGRDMIYPPVLEFLERTIPQD